MSPLRRLLAGFAMIASAALAGCILFTGGTGGYVAADGGAGSGGSCKVASDCADGQFCCYTLDAGIPSLACSSTCAPYQQACIVASDCAPRADGGSGEAGEGGGLGTTYECITQSCPVEGITSANVSTCAPISSCAQ